MRLVLVGVGLAAIGFVVGGMIGQATAPAMPTEIRDARLFPGLQGFDRALIGTVAGATVGLTIWVAWIAFNTLGRRDRLNG